MSTTPVTNPPNKFLEALEKIFTVIPYIAAGVSLIHSDKSIEDKTTLAQQTAQIATAGIIADLPEADQANGQAIGEVANSTLATIVQLLHPSTTTTPPVTD